MRDLGKLAKTAGLPAGAEKLGSCCLSELLRSKPMNWEGTSLEQPDTEAGRIELESKATREVRHEYTLNLPRILEHLGASLLVSTYQAGKLVVVGVGSGGLELSYHNFETAMGIAVRPGQVAVGARAAIWFLSNDSNIARQIEPAGEHDACFLARSARVTGEIQGHEMAWVGEELWVVNTAFSCLCTLDERHSFAPRWKPKFVSALVAEDRCHLNGLACVDGRAKLVTALAETDTAGGWRPSKATTGCLIDVESGETLVRGLAMPHSPRVHQGTTWLLDSGRGRLVVADTEGGTVTTVIELPGYTRGLAMIDTFAFVGLSRIRETSTFGGLPIAVDRESLKCGVAVVDLVSGRQMAFLEFHTGVEEIFDIQLLPGVRSPVMSGPHTHLDGKAPIWTVPASARSL
jgi:uncharacterized protein (TIGR03032 family)